MSNISISNLKKIEDLEIIAEEYASHYNLVLKENWTKESCIKMFKYFYNNFPDLFFMAYDEEKPVGVVMSTLKPWCDGNHLEDAEIFVLKKYQHKGIAKKLFRTLFEYAINQYNATTFSAHTYEDENGFPYSWYKRLGFETIDDWKIINGSIKEVINKL